MSNEKQMKEIVDRFESGNEELVETKDESTKIVKIGDKTTENKLNKFDVVMIKIWSFICSIILKLSGWICKGLSYIFKKEIPKKYVVATVSAILIILLMLILTAPFRVQVTTKETIDLYPSNLIAVQDYTGDKAGVPVYKWGYANKNGEIKIACKYDEAMDFKYGVAFVKQQRETAGATASYWVLINKKGKPVSNLEIMQTGIEPPVQEFSDDVKLARVLISGKYGYLNTNGKIKIDAIYDDAGMFYEGVARVKNGSNVHFINKNGKTVSDSYQDARDVVESRAAVCQRDSGKWGFIDQKGKLVIDTKWDAVSDFRNGYAAVRLGSTYGVIDTKGNSAVSLFKDMNILDYFDID